jgi:NDP-sugar pyrophosphorylase family protein
MKAMILAAGYGTRLRPVTFTLPKPMVPLCNRPLIAWAVEGFLAAGVGDLVVNLHHLPAELERYLHDTYGDRASFHFSYEKDILGTGGGVRRVREQLESEEDFFLVNGDTVQFPQWDDLRDARRKRNSLAALTLRHPPQHDRFTPVYFDDGLVTGFGKGSGEPLMFSGSHVISSRIFRSLPDKEFSGIVDEVYQPLLDSRKETIAGVVDDGLWFDIGTPQRYLAATHSLLDAILRAEAVPPESSRVHGDSLADRSAALSGPVVRSTIGARTVVNGELRDSAVWDDCVIGAGAKLERCIVAHGVEIPPGVDLTNALICREDPAIPADYERRAGFVIVAL